MCPTDFCFGTGLIFFPNTVLYYVLSHLSQSYDIGFAQDFPMGPYFSCMLELFGKFSKRDEIMGLIVL